MFWKRDLPISWVLWLEVLWLDYNQKKIISSCNGHSVFSKKIQICSLLKESIINARFCKLLRFLPTLNKFYTHTFVIINGGLAIWGKFEMKNWAKMGVIRDSDVSNGIHVVGNKAKGRISKRVFQEYKACQIFRKTNISYPLIRTGGKKYSLFGKFDVFCFLETPVLRFALLPYFRRCVFHPNCNKVSHSCSVFIFKLAHDCVLFNEVKPNSYTCLRKS